MDPARPWGRVVLPHRADLRGLAVQLRRVGRLALLGPENQLPPADLEDQPALADLAGTERGQDVRLVPKAPARETRVTVVNYAGASCVQASCNLSC
jgi:hypothetical protein